ncbi:MAG: SpoIID/LytB domain-containing protein [Pyrinomonadaceae bacterium]|nr:SpoIID/LytB domain-containing protein [Pyrinomonadaceae bacterium]
MHHLFARSSIAILLAQSLFVPSAVLAQNHIPGAGRSVASRPLTPKAHDEWKAIAAESIISLDRFQEPATSTSEPTIRVALATNARSATISTAGQLMNATGDVDRASTLVALEVARVRLEARLLSPALAVDPETGYRLQIAGTSVRADTEQKSREVREAIGEEPQLVYGTDTKTWGLLLATRRSRNEAEEVRSRLEEAGFEASVLPPTTSPPSSNPATGTPPETLAQNRSSETRPRSTMPSSSASSPGASSSSVRPASRSVNMVSREVVASAAGAGRLFSSSAPVTFASADEKLPVRYDDKPYRGRIEVFANKRGALTVVNVLGLEDYVKGVVPNELSAGGFPLIEAHKAQAIAARTYALRNRGQFMSEGYDLLPTTRSQVYRGLVSENSFSSRAVDETRGVVATYNGEAINALYTSTCGGRTEDAANIFNGPLPYAVGRECAAEGRAALAPFTIKTTREPAELKEAQNVPIARDVAVLAVHNFTSLKTRISDSWVSGETPVSEVRSWLASTATLARQTAPAVTEEVNRPGPFATALSSAVFGESRANTLLNDADVDYFLAVRDAKDVPESNRSDVAMLVRDGYLAVLPDATLRPRDPLSRARALHSIARILESRNLLQLQKGTARPTADDNLILRSAKGKDVPVKISADAFLFRQIGENVYPVRSVALVGGEPVIFHVSAGGEVDYLEVKPAPNGAAADRFSPFTNWINDLSVGQVQSRLGRAASGIGSLTDLRVVSRGSSRRVTDLEVIGTNGTAHVRGGRIRSALGLREQLFVIERKYDDDGRVTGFSFIGRGWGHGVGMCQVGAYGLARQGFSGEQILKAYYTGIELTRMY